MRLPQLIDYQQAVYGKTFVDPALRNGEPRRTPLGQPSVVSGGFALTFDVKAGGRRYAVRCFHKQSERLVERYAAVANFVRQYRNRLDFLIDVDYVTEGIRVNGRVLPIVRMPWVAGERLDSWVENHLYEPRRLDQVRNQVTTVAAQLRTAGAAHGDLQHGNILVDRAGQLRLVDYDGMFLPALARFGASEHGHRNYQHPDRGTSYDNELDTFAAFVIDLSLAALTHDPSLWWDFNTSENLILEAEDFVAPAESEVFDRLVRIAPLTDRTRRLMDACKATFAAVPAVLSGERTSGRSLRSPAASRLPTGPRAIDAHDRAALLAHVGDYVTIVGRVTDTRIWVSAKATTTFINFGDWRQGAFRIVAWGDVSRQLKTTFGANAEALRGSWVTLSGLVTQFLSKGSDQLSPQIELKRVQTLRELNEGEARDRLSPPWQETPPAFQQKPESAQQPDAPASGQYRWSAPPKPRPNSSVDDLDRRLDQWVSSRSLDRPAPPPPRAPQPYRLSTPRPAPPPSVPSRTSWWQRLRDRWRQ